MVQLFKHKIGEKFSTILDSQSTFSLVIRRVSDSKAFNFVTRGFESISTTTEYYKRQSTSLSGTSLQKIDIDFLPSVPLDVIFEYRNTVDDSIIMYERRLFGGYYEPSLKICVVYGTIIDPSGKPISNALVEAYLNRSGYFIDKTPLIGPSVTALTDAEGYFELPLVQGINVTINVPSVSLTTKGYVPLSTSLKLAPYCLLSIDRPPVIGNG